MFLIIIIAVVVLLAFVLIPTTVKILREYERAVVFTLGRFQKVKGPGLVLLIPFFQQMVRVDLRIRVIEVPSQDVISRDNVSMKVDAVLYFNVVFPMPIDIVKPFLELLEKTGKARSAGDAPRVPLKKDVPLGVSGRSA